MSLSASSLFFSTWRKFFEETASFLDECESSRQAGANENYSEYVLERCDMCIHTCETLSQYLHQRRSSELDWCKQSLDQLIDCLRSIHCMWEELESNAEARFIGPRLTSSSGLGRPKFDVSKPQILYLRSLAFKWSEIAALLGISRMTLYR